MPGTPWPVGREDLLSLRPSSAYALFSLDSCVRCKVNDLGLARRRRGCRAGTKRVRYQLLTDVNNAVSDSTLNSGRIPVVVETRSLLYTNRHGLYRGLREDRRSV